MIRKFVCFDGGHSWKDGYTVGEVVYGYTKELPRPYAAGQHHRVGTQPYPWSVGTECFRVEPMGTRDWIAALPLAIRDLIHRVGICNNAKRFFG